MSAPSDGVWIGVMLAVLGQFVSATSMLLMKRASIIEADLPFFRRRTFQFAFSLFFFNTVVLDAFIYAFAPLTIVAPITALGVVFVNIGVALGCFVERERFGPLGIAANCLIVFGLAVASACGPHSNTTPTISEMYANALSVRFLLYAVPGLTTIAACVLALTLRLLQPRSHLRVIWCAVSAALCGSLSVLSFKGVATSVRLTLQGDDQLHKLGTYLLLLCAGTFAPANVTLMNLTFEESDATYGMPLYQALLILATIVSGGLFYDEFGAWAAEVQARGAPEIMLGFGVGLAALIAGIVLVAYQPSSGAAVPPAVQGSGRLSRRSSRGGDDDAEASMNGNGGGGNGGAVATAPATNGQGAKRGSKDLL